MSTWEIIRFIFDILVIVIGGGWIIRLFTVKSHIKQEQSNAAKADAEAKTNEIDNVKKIFEELYQPFLNDLENRLEKVQSNVESVEKENKELKKRMAELEEENGRLRKENEELRDALREIRPDVVPSRRSINAQNQARNNKGQFTKVEE